MLYRPSLCSIPTLLMICNFRCTLGLLVHAPFLSGRTTNKQCISTTAIFQGTNNNVGDSSWSVTDDWSRLSEEHPSNALPDSGDIFNTDMAFMAAQAIESASSEDELGAVSEDDVLIGESVDIVHNHGMFYEEGDPALYDTSFDEYTKTINFENDMGDEISMLVRCNEYPEEMLVSEGRALAPLTTDEKDDSSQLFVVDDTDGTYQQTDFFHDAVSLMFQEHSEFVPGLEMKVLKPQGVASWMTKSLGDEEHGTVGPHDRRVGITIAKFGTYGTGYMTEADFQQMYLSIATKSNGTVKKPVTHYSAIKKVDQPTLKSIWRDIRNHSIISPVEAERIRMAEELRAEYGAADKVDTIKNGEKFDDALLDECEILGWPKTTKYSKAPKPSSASSSSLLLDSLSKDDLIRQSSHHHVELASDKKTPKRLRDGDFVFIDEESCIGCTQCAQIAPNSFLMRDSGRARTFVQRKVADVVSAVSACPVNCMHYVGFDELKEMEIARDTAESDEGKEDRRHLNHRQGHTPLHVSGRDSDANHKSSWYHYLKNKCFMSKGCPQKGCYDCPHFSEPGMNPYFKEKHKQAEHIRAQDFMKSGEADFWRKTADL